MEKLCVSRDSFPVQHTAGSTTDFAALAGRAVLWIKLGPPVWPRVLTRKGFLFAAVAARKARVPYRRMIGHRARFLFSRGLIHAGARCVPGSGAVPSTS